MSGKSALKLNALQHWYWILVTIMFGRRGDYDGLITQTGIVLGLY